jgi:hypothetical protein
LAVVVTPTTCHDGPMDEERQRVAQADRREAPWRRWGPYLSERAWGTVREDYSANGDAWSYFPFEHAASRAFRWSEDGLAGLCDDQQVLCLALGLWNGKDPILKERPYGLTGKQGNHGEDVKDYWWYLDATPTSSWLQWRYHYPQSEFPYEDLRRTNAARTRQEPEYELIDTGAFAEDRYWAVTVTWAKETPEDLLWRIEVTNRGPDPATLDVLPTIWYRNRWSWDPSQARPRLERLGDGASVVAHHPDFGVWRLDGSGAPDALFCDNETNLVKLYGVPGPAWPKDGIADHVISGAPTVNPRRRGTKASLWYKLTVPSGAATEIRLRFRRVVGPDRTASAVAASPEVAPLATAADLGPAFAATLRRRQAEADDFHASLAPKGISPEEAGTMRQAAAGMLWSKQFFHYDVDTWLRGDPNQPAPPPQRLGGRNSDWGHLDNRDILSMPDPWEYPWYASWDLAFHCVPLAHLDAEFAKRQLILLCREWYMHPNGQLPAYEWNFGDVNPPVHAWSALRVFEVDYQARSAIDPTAEPDFDFLERLFHKLMLNFTWWINRKDAAGNNVFEGGFLGLDNIGMFDRSQPLPVAGRLEQSDGTAWMAAYCLNLLEMAMILADRNPVYEDLATKFFEHFTYIAWAMEHQGLWDEDDGFFYDVIHLADGTRIPVKVTSMVGIVALFAVTVLSQATIDKLPTFAARWRWFVENKPQYAAHVGHPSEVDGEQRLLLSVVDGDQLRRVLARVLDPEELLSPFGLRSLSHRLGDQPFSLDLGGSHWTIDYEPAESTNELFGGNSNWRGPVWFPLNYLLIESLDRFARYFGEDFRVEYPTGSGLQRGLVEVADDLARRLVSIFLPGPDGRRAVFGDRDGLAADPHWRDQLWFHEYFHGDTGAGLGASHQTGWTGLVLDLVADRRLGGRS